LIWLEEEWPDFNSFWYKHSWHNQPPNDRSISQITKRLFLHYLQKQNKRNMHWNKQKNVNKFHLSDQWPPTAMTSVRWLTMFAVSCSSQSIRHRLVMLMKSGSDSLKSGAFYRHYCQWIEKASACLCSHKGPTYQIFTISSWTTGELDKLSAKVTEIWTKCASCLLL